MHVRSSDIDFCCMSQGFKDNLHAVFCLAENSVGPTATRPDDIHTLYSGKWVLACQWKHLCVLTAMQFSCNWGVSVVSQNSGDKQHGCWREAGALWWCCICSQRSLCRHHTGHGDADRCSGAFVLTLCVRIFWMHLLASLISKQVIMLYSVSVRSFHLMCTSLYRF